MDGNPSGMVARSAKPAAALASTSPEISAKGIAAPGFFAERQPRAGSGCRTLVRRKGTGTEAGAPQRRLALTPHPLRGPDRRQAIPLALISGLVGSLCLRGRQTTAPRFFFRSAGLRAGSALLENKEPAPFGRLRSGSGRRYAQIFFAPRGINGSAVLLPRSPARRSEFPLAPRPRPCRQKTALRNPPRPFADFQSRRGPTLPTQSQR
jgi:hypothetical protein